MGTDHPKPKQFLFQFRFVLHLFFLFSYLFLSSAVLDEKTPLIGVNGCGVVGFPIIMNLLFQDNIKAKLVAINEPSMLVEDMAGLLNYFLPGDQQHVFEADNENTLRFGPNSVIFRSIRNPAEIPWAEMGVEYVIESTGSFTEKDKAAGHLEGGAKKVIITDTSKDVPMYVFGVNEEGYKPDQDDIVSSAHLITNHVAPILQVFHERFGIRRGDMKILKPAIATQHIDGTAMMDDMDRRRAFLNSIPILNRGANAGRKIIVVLDGIFGIGGSLMSPLNTISSIIDAVNAVVEFVQDVRKSIGIDNAVMTTDGPGGASSSGIIPADVEAVGKILHYLDGKLKGTVSHGPSMFGSVVDLTVSFKVEATLEEIKAAIKEESEGKFEGILGYTEGDHSRDTLGDRRSSIFNALPTVCSALNDDQFKFIFFCDNYWGYSCRVIDLILHMDSVEA